MPDDLSTCRVPTSSPAAPPWAAGRSRLVGDRYPPIDGTAGARASTHDKKKRTTVGGARQSAARLATWQALYEGWPLAVCPAPARRVLVVAPFCKLTAAAALPGRIVPPSPRL